MNSDNAYHFVRLSAPANKLPDIADQLHKDNTLAPGLWGVFRGLFGVPNTQLWCIHQAAESRFSKQPPHSPETAMEHATTLSSEGYLPTLRPGSFRPLTLDGLYVFRHFVIAQQDLAEFLRLSGEAWQTFEHAEQFEAEPVGLFQPSATADENSTRLLLITRYSDFKGWETSRTADPAATANFRRRAELTLETTAYATRLVRPRPTTAVSH